MPRSETEAPDTGRWSRVPDSRSLDAAERRLHAFLRSWSEGRVSFAQPLSGAEAELAALLDGVGGDLPAGASSFGLGTRLAGVWNQALAEVGELLERLEHWTLYYAWVEILQDGRLQARTAVGWGGDVNTIVLQGLDADARERHADALERDMDARTAFLRTFAIVVAGAVRIAGALSLPGGQALALAAAWRFVHSVIDELRDGSGG
jgi:hypothetical protein